MKLTREHFYCNRRFRTKESLFKTVYKDLLKQGYVNKDFYKALITRERKFPTGIESPINIGIPHADPEVVRESTFVVATLQKPIAFANMVEPDRLIDVSLVIFIVLKNGKDQISFLQRVTDLVGESEQIKRLLKQGCEEQFAYFEDFFSQI